MKKKETIASLHAKGWTQDKIARTLKIRKQKVSTYLRKHEIGKRSKWGEHVRTVMEMNEVSYREAQKIVKKKPYWARKRVARMSKKELAKLKVPGYWQKPKRPPEELRGTFIEVEGIMYYEGVD